MRSRLRLGLLLGVALLLARPAWSQSTQQKALGLELYRAGTLLYEKGEYREAIRVFERSLAAHPHDNTLYALGEAHRRVGQLRQSHGYYSRYAERLPEEQRQRFLVKLRQLREGAVSTVTVTTDPPGATVWIDGRRSGSTARPLRVELRAGTYRLRLARDGYREVRGALKTEFGEPVVLHMPMSAQSEPPQPDLSRPVERRKHPRSAGWFLGAAVGPAVAGYSDSSLSVEPSVAASLEAGYLWGLGRFGLLLALTAQVTPVTDAVVDDSAAFVNLLAAAGGRVSLARGLWLELRFGLGPAMLAGAASNSFLVQAPGTGEQTYVGLALQPALRLGWTFWRGLTLVVSPGAVDYSPRVGGFAQLAPSIGGIWRYHASVGVGWSWAQ